MRLVLAAGAGFAVFRLGTGRRRRGLAAAAVAGAIWCPAIGLPAAAVALAIAARRRFAARRRARVAAAADVVLLAELVALGLSAGLTFAGALGAAACEVHPWLADEARLVLRRGSVLGLAPALDDASGLAGRLYRMAGRAVVTGAPLLPAVTAFVEESRHAEHAHHMAAARRLPVRLLVPLALLILPGFVLLTVGPALLSAVDRLRL